MPANSASGWLVILFVSLSERIQYGNIQSPQGEEQLWSFREATWQARRSDRR